MYQVLIVIHVLLGLGVIVFVMMQQGKGADAGATFGTGTSGSVFGAQGAASFLSRTTAILASLFFLTSLGLAVLSGKQGVAYDLMAPSEVVKEIPDAEANKAATEVPATPTPVAAPEQPAPAPVAPVQQATPDAQPAEGKVEENAPTSDKINPAEKK